MSDRLLDQARIIELLTELGRRLDVRGVRAELFVVGGTAMALAYNTRRTTVDIAAVFEPKQSVLDAARQLADEHDLPEDWLNDGVKGLLPGGEVDAREILERPGSSVSVPSTRYLLALKVAAARIDRDADDIRVLADRLGLDTAAEVLAVTEQVMARRPDRLTPKVRFLVEELFAGPLLPVDPA